MSLHLENAFENDICSHLGKHGWRYDAPKGKEHAAGYNTPHALYPEDLAEWLEKTQPESWASIQKAQGSNAVESLMARVRKGLATYGTLELLRAGLDVVGVKAKLRFAQFKPAMGMNEHLQTAYDANILRVVRQVRTNHNDVLDVVLFLNGLPVATCELKTDFTQSIKDAMDQYRFDRVPKPAGKAQAEPILSFPEGALVHFAVSNSEVMMTTKLQGAKTYFLPFNLGNDGGAGNPLNPKGHQTAYLWEQVWERHSWLDIIGKYLIAQRDKKHQLKSVIFPRYHQLDATRKLVQAIREEGPGQKYLIQHSAGSGKTNSIAWTAHFLSTLHDADDNKMFSTILVVSDRTVLDSQLQEAIYSFERTKGLVASITGNQQSKSKELAEALEADKRIVVCTIQTFPFALKAVQELSATQNKRFAVIADEAHSSQSGEAASKLKELLNAQELSDLNDGGEVSTEDLLVAQMAGRASDTGITYVAFTATPKAKTLELFGRLPDPTQPPSKTNIPASFHVYSMRQAIEEGFILDVLRNYTPYSLAFKIATTQKELNEQEVEKAEAHRELMKFVKLHPFNIAQKIEIVIEHFLANVAPLLNGHAKAMVIVGSRIEAVRWKEAMDSYIKSSKYSLGTLVAFSPIEHSFEGYPNGVKETDDKLNPTLKGRDIRDAFDSDEFQILLVANKFQTGFDQPLLCGMYVDKKLAGVQAVQTLSRLNRAYNGPYGVKDTTYVLDFNNQPDDIKAAFLPYFETAELSAPSDPNYLGELKAKLDAPGYYDEDDLDQIAKIETTESGTQAHLNSVMTKIAQPLLNEFARFKKQFYNSASQDEETEAQDGMNALLNYKSMLVAYVRGYTFLSQIYDFQNTGYLKRSLLYKHLVRLLEFGKERIKVDISQITLTHHTLKNKGKTNIILGTDGEQLTPAGPTGGSGFDKEKVKLIEVLKQINDLFEGELSDDDKLVYVNNVLMGKLLQSGTLVTQAGNNTREQFNNSPDLHREMVSAVMDAADAHNTMSSQLLNSDESMRRMLHVLLSAGDLYGALRAKHAGSQLTKPSIS